MKLFRKTLTFIFLFIVLMDCMLPYGMHLGICFCKDGKPDISIETCSADAPYIYDLSGMDIPATREFSSICDNNVHQCDLCFGCKSNFLCFESDNSQKLSQPVFSGIFYYSISTINKIAYFSAHQNISPLIQSVFNPSTPLLI